MERRYLSPKEDYVFKKIFNNEKEGYLKEFLSLLFKEEMQDLDVMQNTVLGKEHKNNKYCILDVAAKSENTFIALEMQNKVGKDFENRVDMYDRKTGSYLAKAGGDYNNLQFKQKMVWLLGEKLDNENVCIDNICRVYNKRGRKIKTNSDIFVIELPKIQEGEKRFEDKLWQWLYFLGSERMDETMEKIMEINPMIKKAVQQECMFTQEDIYFVEQFRREEAERLWNLDMKEAEEKGMKKGLEQGVKQGVKQGTEKEKMRVVINMYKNKFDIETICLVLNLSQNDVEKILRNRK